MFTHTSLRTVAGLSLAGTALLGLTACGSSSPKATTTPSPTATPSSTPTTPSLTMKQRAAEAKVCMSVGKELAAAQPLLAQLTTKKLTPAQAMTQLKPIATKIEALAKSSASLPIGPALTTLSNDIAAAQKSKPKNAAAIQAEVKKLSADATAALAHCAK